MTNTVEPDETSVPMTLLPAEPTIADLYAVLVDMHRMEAEKLSIIRGVADLANSFGEQIPALMEQVQESPLFGMLSGGGGGIGGMLGGLFRH